MNRYFLNKCWGKLNGQSQFNKDRRAWLDDGAMYPDLDKVDRFWKDHRDNPDATNMIQAIVQSAFTPARTGAKPGQGQPSESNMPINRKAVEANEGNTRNTGSLGVDQTKPFTQSAQQMSEKLLPHIKKH